MPIISRQEAFASILDKQTHQKASRSAEQETQSLLQYNSNYVTIRRPSTPSSSSTLEEYPVLKEVLERHNVAETAQTTSSEPLESETSSENRPIKTLFSSICLSLLKSIRRKKAHLYGITPKYMKMESGMEDSERDKVDSDSWSFIREASSEVKSFQKLLQGEWVIECG